MKKILPVILALIAVGVGSFLGGMKYGQSKIVTDEFAMGNDFVQGNRPAGLYGNGTSTRDRAAIGGFTSGEIIANDGKSVTLKLSDGGSKIIFYSDITVISKSANGTKSDLKVGENIIVSGESNSDGSITAKSIQLGAGQRMP